MRYLIGLFLIALVALIDSVHAGAWTDQKAREAVAHKTNGRVEKTSVTTRTHTIKIDDAKHYDRAIQKAKEDSKRTGKKAGVSFTGGSKFDQERAERKAKAAGVKVFK